MISKSTRLFIGIEELDELLDNYNIHEDDFCLIGGVSLSVLGVRVNNDIDILVSQKVYDEIKQKNQDKCKWNECELVRIGNIDIKKDYYKTIGFDDDRILNDNNFYFIHQKYKVIRPELVLATKTIRRANHDIRDIKLLEKKIENSDLEWSWDLVRESLLFKQNHISPAKIAVKTQKISVEAEHRSLKSRFNAALYLYRTNPVKAAKVTVQKISGKLGIKIFSSSPAKDSSNETKSRQPNLTEEIEAQVMKFMPVPALLHCQIYDGRFNRYDILLRYLVLNAFLNKRSDDIAAYSDYYWMMQEKRIGKNRAQRYSEEKLNDLLLSMKENGFNPRYPIPVSEEGIIIDGAHRMACALLTGIKHVPVAFLSSRQKIDYSRNWFVENSFPDALISKMDELLEQLLFDKGIYFLAIVWPPAFSFAEDIQNDIARDYRIVKSFDINLREELFNGFAREIYAIDDIDKWKIEVKISAMSSYPKQIRAIYLEIQEPDFRIKQEPRSYLSKEGEALKKRIRSTYRDKIPDYFYDIIFHTGDNQEHNLAMTKVLAKHDNRIAELIQ